MSGRRLRASQELVLATAGMATVNMGVTGIAAISPLLRVEFGLSATGIGLIGAVIYGMAAALTFAGGAMTDALGAGATLAVAQGTTALGLIAVASAPTAATLYIALAGIGIGFGMVSPPTNVLARTGSALERRGLVMSLKQTGVTIGGAVGALTAALLAAAAGWRTALVLPAVICLLVGVWALAIHRRRSGPEPETSSAMDPRRLRRLSPRAMAVYGFVMGGAQLSLITFLPVYLVEDRGLDPAVAGAALAVALAAGTFGRIGWGMAFDRFASTRVAPLVLAAAVSGTALILLFVVPDFAIWPLLIVLGMCAIGWNGVFHAIVAEAAGPGRVGRASAVGVFFIVAGSVAMPTPLGLVADQGWGGWGLVWTAAGIFTLVAATTMGWSALRSP